MWFSNYQSFWAHRKPGPSPLSHHLLWPLDATESGSCFREGWVLPALFWELGGVLGSLHPHSHPHQPPRGAQERRPLKLGIHGPFLWEARVTVCLQRLKKQTWRGQMNPSKWQSWDLNSCLFKGFPDGSEGKVSVCNAGDPGSIPRSGRSPGEGNGNPLQYYCLENPMDGGAW